MGREMDSSWLVFFFGEELHPIRHLPFIMIGAALAVAFDRKGAKPKGPWVTCLGGLTGGLLAMDYGVSRGMAVGAVRALSLVGAAFGAVILAQAYEWAASGAAWQLLRGWARRKAGEIAKAHGSGEIKRGGEE